MVYGSRGWESIAIEAAGMAAAGESSQLHQQAGNRESELGLACGS